MPTKKPATPRYSFNVDEAFIKEAYASACQEWKDKIEAQFPDLFKPVPFEFGCEHILILNNEDHRPLYIGMHHAPDGLEGMCLVVNKLFDMEVVTGPHGHKVLTFARKK